MNVCGEKRGNLRPLAMPMLCSSSHRALGLAIAQFASGRNALPQAESVSTTDKAQRLSDKPLAAT